MMDDAESVEFSMAQTTLPDRIPQVGAQHTKHQTGTRRSGMHESLAPDEVCLIQLGSNSPQTKRPHSHGMSINDFLVLESMVALLWYTRQLR